ncbi:MAG: thrombospondin type 3 repeat-containing protein, partial [archaeon]
MKLAYLFVISVIIALLLAASVHAVDSDGDGIPDEEDNCPWHANPDQEDWDSDEEGNECDCDDHFKGDNEVGADCGGICEFECPPCVPLIENGLHDAKIDVVFIPDVDYEGDMEKFISDAMRLVENGYLSDPIMWDFRCKYNFYYYPEWGEYQPVCALYDVPDDFYDHCGFADSKAIVFATSKRACSVTGVFSTPRLGTKTVVHETGHNIFGLADEYCCDGGYWQPNPNPNIFSTLGECQLWSQNPSDCTEFCPGHKCWPTDPEMIQACKDWYLNKKGIANATFCSCSEYALANGMDPLSCATTTPGACSDFWHEFWPKLNVTDTSCLTKMSPNWCNWRGNGIQPCCSVGWWKADADTCRMRNGNLFEPDCANRVEMKFVTELPECANPGEPDWWLKRIPVLYEYTPFVINPYHTEVMYGYTPNYFTEGGGYVINLMTASNTLLGSFNIQNPTTGMLERDEEPFGFELPDNYSMIEFDEGRFDIVVPFLEGIRKVEIRDASGGLLEETDLGPAIVAFCEEMNYDDPECGFSDLDEDSLPDSNDNCPLHYNIDQGDEDEDGAGDACDNC